MAQGVSPEVRKKIDEQYTDDLCKRLVAYAARKIRNRWWRGQLGGPLPGAATAEDIAIDAIDDVYTGQCHWDPDTQPDLYTHLKGRVDTIIANLVRSHDNRMTRTESSFPSEGDEGQEIESPLLTVPDSVLSPEDAVIDQEFLLGFIEEIGDDPMLIKVVEAMLDGHLKRGEIAEHLGISADEMTNIKKRLARRLVIYREKWNSGRVGQNQEENS